MSLIFRIPGVTFTKTLPKLERDAVIKAGETVGVYDALNTESWAKQAAPTTGSPSADRWINLVDGVANGQFFENVGWSSGFVSNSGIEKIALLNNVAPAATSKLLGIVWIKHGASQPGTGQHSILNLAQRLELRYASVSTTNVNANKFYLAGAATANREIATPVAGTVTQVAVYFENTTRIAMAYVNGVQVISGPGFADMGIGGDVYQLLNRSGIDGGYLGTIYRTVVDNCASRTPGYIVERDYALNSGRFS